MKLTPANWIAIVSLVLTGLGVGGALAWTVFFARSDGAALEMKVSGHIESAGRLQAMQEKLNERTTQALDKMQEAQQRISENVVRIGEHMHVRKLDKGENDGP